ncbi:unnamed protein product [Clonostachys solani]|uniref:Uncharacterized protein n=1 Tax=Clonostachys solani TaxID=160281 RepID=A0A9P0ERE6_9HYPO|nr:unnamed protein product [Clonostachys solani]
MSVEDEWRSVRPVQRGKTEVIFCRDEKGNSLPPKILESATSDSPESIVDYTGFYKPYLRWPGAIAPDRDSGLSCPPAEDCPSNVSGRLRSHSLQEGKPGKLEESWNLLTMIKNWVFNDYDPPAKRGGLSPKSSSRHEHTQISNTGSPFFRDLEAGMLGPSFFDYSSDEELDTSFHTARDESSDSTNETISLERLSSQETLFGDKEAEKLNAKPRSPMESGFTECSVYGFSGKSPKLPKGRESLLGGDEDKPRRPSPNEPRVSKPFSRLILESDWELNFSLGASLFYDLVEEQGPTGHVVGGSTGKIGNNKGGQEK